MSSENNDINQSGIYYTDEGDVNIYLKREILNRSEYSIREKIIYYFCFPKYLCSVITQSLKNAVLSLFKKNEQQNKDE
tara:strand:+ start:305 stop:538 length:234 start_codon:yes stop_codon:yes gene_type:complete